MANPASYAGTLDGSGPTTPSNYTITLNGNATLRHVIRRTAPLALAPVPAPPAPSGTRSVNLNNSAQPVGDWATLRNLTLNGNVGQIAIPPGTYGDFTANGGSGFTLGTAGDTVPAVYNFQRFNLNGQAQIRVLGPTVINLRHGFSANGQVGLTDRPDWLTLNVTGGGFNLNGGSRFYGTLNAPASTVIINGNSRLVGGLIADKLILNGGGLLRLEQSGGGGPVNTAPVAADQSVETPEDTPLAITLTATDAEGDALTYDVLAPPAHGTLSGTAPALVYTPTLDYHGADTFTFRARDPAGLESAPATISITITPINDAPVALPASADVDEDTTVVITLSSSDPDGDELTYALATPPTHGTANLTGNLVTYTPAADYHGPDSFTFTVNDGALGALPAPVQIWVSPVLDLPVPQAQRVELAEDTSITLTLTGVSELDAPLRFELGNLPRHGLLTGSGALLVYRPAKDFSGIDTFTFTATDDVGTSTPATVTLVVLPVNDAPVAFPATVRTSINRPILLPLAGADVEQATLSVSPPAMAAHGTIMATEAGWLYTPASDYVGEDAFDYTVSDGELVSEPATVRVLISPENAAPVVSAGQDRTVSLMEGMVALQGFVSDDGLPASSRVSLEWIRISGPGEVRFENAEQASAAAVFSAPGSHVLRLTANDGELAASDDVVITVKENARPRITSQPVTSLSFPIDQDNSSELVMTVRDFSDRHIDFEYASGFGGRPAVLPILGPDRTPVFTGPDGMGQIASAASFYQWYHDVPGINATATIRLPLTPKPDNPLILQYASDEFFPIDGQLFGNEGRSRNYHFTAEWHSRFVYRGGEVLTFRGDDDVWVFIDDELVIDLGGIHGPEERSVNLDNLGLVLGQAYPIDLFFAERQTVGSSFRLETTLLLYGAGIYQYDVEANDPDGDEITYRLLQAPPDMAIDATSGRITWPVGSNEIGRVTVVVEATDTNGLTDTQTYELEIRGNERPIVATPAFVTATPGEPLALNAFVYDDGQPAGSVLSTQWRVIPENTGVVIESSSPASASATFDAPGFYTLEFSATDSQSTTRSTTTVRVAEGCAPLPTGVVAWWPFNNSFSDLVTQIPLTTDSWFEDGHVGSALSLAGTWTGLAATGRSDLNLAGPSGFTVELWVDRQLEQYDGYFYGTEGSVLGWNGSLASVALVALSGYGSHAYELFYRLRMAPPGICSSANRPPWVLNT